MIKNVAKYVFLTLSCQSGRNTAARAAAVCIISGLATLFTPPVLAQANWAHQATGFQSNGQVIVKTLSGGAYSSVANATGAMAKVNQTAATQPPTVLLKGRSKAYRANGASCIYPGITPSDEIDVYYEVDKSKKMTCWTDYPYAGTWRVDGTTIPCFVGMDEAYVPQYCSVGGGVQASKDSSTIIGLYIGRPSNGGNWGNPAKHLIADLADLSQPEYWGCAYTDPTQYGGYNGSLDEWDGKANTANIRYMMVNTALCSSPAYGGAQMYWSSAANKCYTKTAPIGEWFLPAPRQLEMIFKNPALMLKLNMANVSYWSSELAVQSTDKYGSAFGSHPQNIFQYSSRAWTQLPVRCVRNFN